jgi:protein-tyrosine kinase
MERIKKAMEKARAGVGATARSNESQQSQRFERAMTSRLLSANAKVIPCDPESLERHRIIAGNTGDPRATWFDMLGRKVLREMRHKGYRTLAVSSPMPECGKTTVAINIALSITQQIEPQVLLVDFDFRRPKIAEYLGINPNHSLSHFLSGSVPLEETIVDPGIPGLLVLPNAKVHRNAVVRLNLHRVKNLMAILNTDKENRVSICDLPPLLSTDDAIALLPQMDCILLVVADRSTKKPELEQTLHLLEGSPLLGVVLNKSDVSPRPY